MGIPTVSTWGLAVLTLLVLTAGSLVIRRATLWHGIDDDAGHGYAPFVGVFGVTGSALSPTRFII